MIDELQHTFSYRLRVTVLACVLALIVLPVILYVAGETLTPLADRNEYLAFFLRIFLSIIFEALPFVLFGALLSGTIEMFVSRQRMLSLVPKGPLRQLLAGAAIGVVLPVCECGVIVVLRRLLKKGLPLRMALTYLLAAPIVNPVVIVSTFVAFRGKSEWLFMPLARVGFGVAIAMAVASWLGRDKFRSLIKVYQGRQGEPPPDEHAGLSVRRRLSAAADHALDEFLDVMKYLILGAAVAGVLQTFVDRSLVSAVADSPVLGVVGLMGLAVALNLCSEADAFVAVGLVGFGVVARLAFLVLGPMLDMKLLYMYGAVFERRFILRLALAIVATVFVVMCLLSLAEFAWVRGVMP
jgi:uncharacterized membrane protein YraQ (UPF0718 family)